MADEPGMIVGSGESWIGRGHQALLRGIGGGGAIALGISASGLAYTGLLPFSTVAGLWAGTDLPGILTVALLISLVVAFTYAVIGSAVPRSGADYILASRVLNAPAAFTSSWIFVIISGLAAGSIAAFIPRVVLPTFGRVISENSGLTGVNEIVNVLQQPQAMILIGTFIVAGAFFSMFVPQRFFIRMLSVGVLLILAVWVVIAVVFSGTLTDGFSQAWNQVMGAGDFERVIPAAKSMGYLPVNDLNRVVLGGSSLALFIFFGFFFTTFAAGEIRKPERSLWRASGASLFISWAVLAGAATLLIRAVSSQWLSAQSYLSLSPGFSGEAVPWITIYAAVLLPGLLVGLVMVAWIYSLINLVQVYIFFSSRIMLAWADDGLLPAGMTYVHPRYRSPLVTMLLAAVLVEIGLVNQLMGGFFTTPLNYVYFVLISMLVPVTSITFFPFLKKSWFQSCPPLVRMKIGPLPIISLTGFLTLVYLISLVISPLWVSGGIAPAGPVELVIFAFMIASGWVWYWGRRLALRSEGIQVDETFKTLPHLSSDH